ncbi:type II toxin-antitoxin system PemK/MazF family toxin [Ruania alba]|uniref:type II toxin-antitoxin system PemK/MazF family toxin n=1 Tax=Ruania alba TaxID=648782 RepID=UPI001FDFD2E7|nr:type II toxin-antitoxin system PemK/MazF family toxin [Ruania alba]
MTAARVLRSRSNVVQVVPLMRTVRQSAVEIVIEPDGHNGLHRRCSAQCQYVRSVATRRVIDRWGNVGPLVLRQVRGPLSLVLDT